MAKQVGPNFIIGTIGKLTFYKMNGNYYVKRTTQHRRERVRRNPRFSATMDNARSFGKAQQLASAIYKKLPYEKRNWLRAWLPLRNRAQELLRKRLPDQEISKLLAAEFLTNNRSVSKKTAKKATVKNMVQSKARGKKKVA